MSRTEKPNRDRELASGGQGRWGQGVTLMGARLPLESCECSENCTGYTLAMAMEALSKKQLADATLVIMELQEGLWSHWLCACSGVLGGAASSRQAGWGGISSRLVSGGVSGCGCDLK